MPCIYVSVIGFEQIFVSWEALEFLEILYNEITVTYKHEGFIG